MPKMPYGDYVKQQRMAPMSKDSYAGKRKFTVERPGDNMGTQKAPLDKSTARKNALKKYM